MSAISEEDLGLQFENKKFKNRLQIPIDKPGFAQYYGLKEN